MAEILADEVLGRVLARRRTLAEGRLLMITSAGGTEAFLRTQNLPSLAESLAGATPEALAELSPEELSAMEDRLTACRACKAGECSRGEYIGQIPTVDGGGRIVLSRCDARAEWEMRENLHNCGVPKKLLGCTFDNYEPQTPTQAAGLEMARAYAEGLPQARGLMIAGPVGTGKSHLSVAIMRAAVKRRMSCRFDNVLALLEQVKWWIGQNNPRAGAMIDRCIRADFLVLDDIGTAGDTDFVKREILHIVGSRYDAELPTIFTTNNTIGELKELLGQRTVSRLMDTCDGLLLDGEDYRETHGSTRRAEGDVA